MVDGGILLLALEDVLPVILSGIGLWVLARLSARADRQSGWSVVVGALLIVIGGLTKPVFKLLLAFSAAEVDLLWLDDALFWLLAPGFLIASAGLWRAGRLDMARPVRGGRWGGAIAAVVVTATASATAIAGSGAWFIILLTAATAGNVLAILALISWARGRHDRMAAVLFGGNLLLVFGLAGAAAALEQTFAVQLGEQLVSTAAQAMFMWASVRLARARPTDSQLAGTETMASTSRR
jgi:hypothetical protein